MNKIVVLANDIIEFWDDLGQSPSAINAGGNIFIGRTNEYSEENLEEMQKDVDNGDCYRYGSGSLRDWGIGKYNLI